MAEQSFGMSELMKRKASEMVKLTNRDIRVKKRMIDQGLHAQRVLGLESEQKIAINDDVERMSTQALRNEIRKYPEMRLSGSKPQLQSRLRKLMRGEAFPVEESDEEDAPEETEDTAHTQEAQLATLEAEKERINKVIKGLKKGIKELDTQDKMSPADAEEFYKQYTNVEPAQLSTITAGSTIVFAHAEYVTSGTLLTIQGGVAIVQLNEKKGMAYGGGPGPDSTVVVDLNRLAYVVPPEMKKDLQQRIKKMKNHKETSAGSMDSYTPNSTPRNSTDGSGSGLGGERDEMGRCEGQLIASGIEASMTSATTVVWTAETIDAALADESIEVHAANGNVQKGHARKLWLINKRRRFE